MTNRLPPGDLAPKCALTAGDGARLRLADLRDRDVVLYFSPAAGTPGCTAEARDRTARLLEPTARRRRPVCRWPDRSGRPGGDAAVTLP